MRIGYIKKYENESLLEMQTLLLQNRCEGTIHIESKKGIEQLMLAARRCKQKKGSELVIPGLHHLSLDIRVQAQRIKEFREAGIYIVSLQDGVHTKKMSLKDIYGVAALTLTVRSVEINQIEQKKKEKVRVRRRRTKIPLKRYVIQQEYMTHREFAEKHGISERTVTNYCNRAIEEGLLTRK